MTTCHACTACLTRCRYDLRCDNCCVRLVASCWSVAAPKVARTQQEAMLALIERRRGSAVVQRTISALRAGKRAA